MTSYILTSTTCLSISYLIFLVFFRKEHNFKHSRYFLLSIVLLSVILPATNFHLNLELNRTLDLNYELFNLAESKTDTDLVNQSSQNTPASDSLKSYMKNNWQNLIQDGSFVVCIVLLMKFITQIFRIFVLIALSKKHKSDKYTIVYSKKAVNTSSFFYWIFINPDKVNITDMDKIIVHEKIHASQFHSIDRILIELLSAVMWFNPIIWKIRKNIELVHEYLADEGALGTGIDRLKYQALLLNHVTEEKLICFSSSFNHSLIKKRMLMISKRNLNRKTKLKVFVLIPLAIAMFFGVAVVNAQSDPANALIDIPEKTQKQAEVNSKKNQLRIGQISWEGINSYASWEVITAFEIKTGDIYDSLKIQKHLFEHHYGVPGFYFNNAHAFYRADVEKIYLNRNTVDLKIKIFEGNKCKFGNISIKGNKKTHTEDLIKSLKIKSGDWFTAKEIVKSIEALRALNKFNPDKITPNVTVDTEKCTETLGIINVEFELTEI